MTRRSILIAAFLMTLLALVMALLTYCSSLFLELDLINNIFFSGDQKRKSGNCIDRLWCDREQIQETRFIICSETGIQLANRNGVRISNVKSIGPKRIYEHGKGLSYNICSLFNVAQSDRSKF